jgi:hypothetical protein
MMDLPSSQRGSELLELMRRHVLGAEDAALLDENSLRDHEQAAAAFEIHFDYGRPFPECLRLSEGKLVFIGDAGPIIDSEEMAKIAELKRDTKVFLVENQVPEFTANNQPPIMMQFDSVSAMASLLASTGAIRQKLIDFMVGEYFVFSSDGAIAKYLAYDQIEPLVAIVADKEMVAGLVSWIRHVVGDSRSEWEGESSSLRISLQEGQRVLQQR